MKLSIQIDKILSAGLFTMDGKKVLDLTDTWCSDSFVEDDIMYLVIQCRKCEHRVYIDVNNRVNLLKTLGNIAENYDCPECGEEPYENWILIGTADSYPGDE